MIHQIFFVFFIFFIQMCFAVGIYGGIYIDQHYKVPKVDDPTALWNKFKETVEQYRKDVPGSSKGD